MNLRFLDPAEEEMLEAAQLYEDHATGLGERFWTKWRDVRSYCLINPTSVGGLGNSVGSRSANSLSR